MYYLYQHIRLDKKEVFYIGISRWNKNFKYKRASQRDKRNSIWKNIVSKTNFKYEILFESEDISFIKEKEIELISLYGKIKENTGTLANITDGGEGTFGYKPTKETLLKQANLMKGRKASEETKLKMHLAQINKIVPPEVGIKISNTKKGIKTGKLHDNKPIKVIHIETNMEFSSIAKAASSFKLRRCTLAKEIHSGKNKNFKIDKNETGKRRAKEADSGGKVHAS